MVTYHKEENIREYNRLFLFIDQDFIYKMFNDTGYEKFRSNSISWLLTMKENCMKVIFVEDKSSFNPMCNCILADLYEKYEFDILIESVNDSKIIKKMKRQKGQKLGLDKLNFLFTKQYKLRNFLKEKDGEKIIVVFFNSSFIHALTPYTYLQECKKQKNVYFVLYYIDIVKAPQSMHANFLASKNLFDKIYTFDVRDATTYNYKWWPTPYSAVEDIQKVKPLYDAYFCGSAKGRTAKIIDIQNLFMKYDVDVHMDIVSDEKRTFDKLNDFSNILLHEERDVVPYNKILKKTLQAKCILDIVQEGQAGLSLRPYEAVVYNRRLLTNNKSVFDFQYYDPRYMKYFETIDDIDWKWVKEDLFVDYNYQGEFSPIRLIEDFINEISDEKEDNVL